MERYDYYEAVKKDVERWIQENVDPAAYEDPEDLEGYLMEELWADDSVTGNGSGSYTFSTWQAEENLCHNWALLSEALEGYGEYGIAKALEMGAESCDVIIRCYLLSRAVEEVVGELYE